VWYSGFRPIPERLKTGELEPLRDREIRFPRGGAAFAGSLSENAVAKLRPVGAALRAYAGEPSYLAKLLASLGWTFAAARWVKRERIGHIHANWAHLPATSAWIVSRLTGVPYSFSAHAGRDLFRTSALLGEKTREARFVVVCNHVAKERLIEVGGGNVGGKIHVCAHGVDLERFSPGGKRERSGLLSVGNLDPAKGFDVMIRALGGLRETGVELRYRIVGEGPERRRLETVAEESGVAALVELGGRLEGDALVEAYRKAAVFVAPSRLLPGGGRDGLPNVVVEAMACGAPVVGSRIAAIPEAIEHESTGLLVSPEDPLALAGAVRRMVDDSNLAGQLADAARARVAEQFDRARNVKRFIALFADLDAGRRDR
jgi:glycosyltransferase involved in cell wall biosynthesis